MKSRAFHQALPDRLRMQLPVERRNFSHRVRATMAQLWYGNPAFHYEIWTQRRRGVIEVGLHLEHREAHRNAALHAFFDRHFVEIRHELGEIWLEKWDRGWHKLYRTFPFEGHTDAVLEAVTRDCVGQILVLQPFLEDGLRELSFESSRKGRG